MVPLWDRADHEVFAQVPPRHTLVAPLVLVGNTPVCSVQEVEGGRWALRKVDAVVSFKYLSVLWLPGFQ